MVGLSEQANTFTSDVEDTNNFRATGLVPRTMRFLLVSVPGERRRGEERGGRGEERGGERRRGEERVSNNDEKADVKDHGGKSPTLTPTCGWIHLVVDEASVAKGNQQVSDLFHCEHSN